MVLVLGFSLHKVISEGSGYSAEAAEKKQIEVYGTLKGTKESYCTKLDLQLCHKVTTPDGILYYLAASPEVSKKRLNTLEDQTVIIKGRKETTIYKQEEIQYLTVFKIEKLSPLTTIKAAEFPSQTALTEPSRTFSALDSLKLGYVYGRLNENNGSQANIELVKRIGLKRYIPMTITYPPVASLLEQLKALDPNASPDYAVCFNEPNPMSIYKNPNGWSIDDTRDRLGKCISGFKDVWPNIKIIVSLGSQVDWQSDGTNDYPTDSFFPHWPIDVWPAFETHMKDIYGFGLHLYPTWHKCETEYEDRDPNYPWHTPPKNWPNSPESVIECTRRYIYAAKKLLQSHGVNKALAFTEYGLGDVNSLTSESPWKNTLNWQKLWQMFSTEKIEFVSIYAPIVFRDGTHSFNPATQCKSREQYRVNSLVSPCQNMMLTSYGIAYANF